MLWYNPCNSKHKHYVPPSTNYSCQELQFYFGYKHIKVAFTVGEDPHVRPQAESLFRREHSWEHSSASPPASSASQAVALPTQLHFPSSCRISELKGRPKCLVVAEAAEESASDPAVQELRLRERQKHTQTVFL